MGGKWCGLRAGGGAGVVAAMLMSCSAPSFRAGVPAPMFVRRWSSDRRGRDAASMLKFSGLALTFTQGPSPAEREKVLG
jgi:hypothetical protein